VKSENLAPDPLGAVMVVGAGIAGVQAALDLATANCSSECITLLGFSHKQIYTQIDQALAELQMEVEAAG
jgi:thioredoxin reductase